MTRNLTALAIVLLLALAAPVAAIAGFCAKMPCCSHAHTTAVKASKADCCDTVKCSVVPQQQAQKSSLSELPLPEQEANLSTNVHTAHQTVTLPKIESSPPLTSPERLALLSILLI